MLPGRVAVRADEIQLLACPHCKSTPLDTELARVEDGKLVEGTLVCPDCGRETAVRSGVPFFAPWADDLGEKRPSAWEDWARAHRNYRAWHETRWTEDGARNTKPLFERFWRFAETSSGTGVDIGGGRSINREWNPSARIWSVDPESSWALDPLPKFMGKMYRCWDEDFPFIQGVGELLPLRTQAFDFVIIQGVLDHVAEPDLVIDEARRVLKPGGKIWLMVTTTDLEPEVPLVSTLRRRLGRARRDPLGLIAQGPVRFFSDKEQGISEGHVSETHLTRASLREWLRAFEGIAEEDVEVNGIRQLFVRAVRPV